MECHKVKDEHRHLAGLLQPLPIPEKKWEVITMDFITKLPRTDKKHNSIMVVVEKLKRMLILCDAGAFPTHQASQHIKRRSTGQTNPNF
jgi:hypothetical protein